MAKFVAGNRANPKGFNQYGARAKLSMGVSIDTREMGQHARRIMNQGRVTAKPFREANEALAKELQSYMAGNLRESVSRHGRAQRRKSSSDRLAAAIESKANRKVTVDGYSVGYLDQIKAVRGYWRGLEVGSHRHVGRTIAGSFASYGGGGKGGMQLVRPVEGGKDPRFLQFRTRTFASLREQVAARQGEGRSARGRSFGANAQTLGVKIKNPIVGYEFMGRGLRDFRAQGFLKEEAREYYISYMSQAGLHDLVAALQAGRRSLGAAKSTNLSAAPKPPTPNPRA